MICKITLEESQFSDPESIKELQDFTEHQQEKLEQEMQLKIPKEKTAEILLMNELKCMLACISVVTAEKIQGHKCTELAEKSWRLAESIEYIWNAEILNPQIRETVSKAFIRICIGCGSMYLQNVQEEHINPERKKSHYFCIITAIFCFRKKCRSIKSLSIKRSKLQI